MRFFADSTETRKCVNITILDDNIEEGDVEETITVQVVATEPQITLDFGILTVRIMDSDSELLQARDSLASKLNYISSLFAILS